MSTKTTFKRIALVAVAALGFGLLSAVPSDATVQSGSYTIDYNYAAQNSPVSGKIVISGDAATNTDILVLRDQFFATAALDKDTITVSAVQNVKNSDGVLNNTFPVWSVPADQITYNTAHNAIATVQADTSAIKVEAQLATTTVGQATLKFTPAYAGTYVFRLTSTSGWTYDWTVVAVTPDITPVASKSTSFLNAGTGVGAVADETVSASKTTNWAAGSQKATIVVTAKNASSVSVAGTTALTATISGAGYVGIGSAAGSLVPSGNTALGTAGQTLVGVFSNGIAGKATVTISAGTTVLATETVTFYGAAAKLVLTTDHSYITYGGANANAYDAATVTGVVTDADGNTVAASAYTLEPTVPSTTTVCGQWTGGGALGFYGIARGACSGLVTVWQGGSATAVTASTAITVTGIASAVSAVALSGSDYYYGSPLAYSVTYVDSTGAVPADSKVGATGLGSGAFTATAGSVSGTETLTAVVAGVRKSSGLFAPVVTGSLKFTWTNADESTKSADAVVSNVDTSTAQAAADAAAEATDAANAATDAANAAAEAADAATAAAQDAADAVAALSAQVADLIAGLKAQLTALTNLVIKIQKKVKA